MKKHRYTKSTKWLEARKTAILRSRLKNIKRNVAIYKMRQTNCPMLDIQLQFRLSDETIRKIHRMVQGMIDRNEIDLDLFDS